MYLFQYFIYATGSIFGFGCSKLLRAIADTTTIDLNQHGVLLNSPQAVCEVQ
jgi:hypothetical protein